MRPFRRDEGIDPCRAGGSIRTRRAAWIIRPGGIGSSQARGNACGRRAGPGRPGGKGRFLRSRRVCPIWRGWRVLPFRGRRDPRPGRACIDDAGSPVEVVNVDHHGDGLGVSQAGKQRHVRFGQAGPGVGPGSVGRPACTGRSGLRVSIPAEILAVARARARVPGEWSRAPVIGSGSGWHAIKIQAPACALHEQARCAQITSSLPPLLPGWLPALLPGWLPALLRWVRVGQPAARIRACLRGRGVRQFCR
jgi:hypothetical protein